MDADNFFPVNLREDKMSCNYVNTEASSPKNEDRKKKKKQKIIILEWDLIGYCSSNKKK